MNFLAHQHLSYPYRSEMVGNFMGDYVKGKGYQNYDKEIAQGIILHRHIDTFTDTHAVLKCCKKPFLETYGLYAGVIVDMVFDYLLAKNWHLYCDLTLDVFAEQVYANLFENYKILPHRIQEFLPKMKAAQRLQSYATLSGITEAIRLMSRYTSLPDHTLLFREILMTNEQLLETYFFSFYDEMQHFVNKERTDGFIL